MNYEVQAIRSGHYWELHIRNEGVTQSRTLAGAPSMVRDWLATEYERDFADAVVTVHPVLDSIEAKHAYARKVGPIKVGKVQKVSRPRASRLVHS